MKHALLLFLLLPLPAFAQSGRTYASPTMSRQMQSVDQFNRMTNQRTQAFQQRQMQLHQGEYSGRRATPAQEQALQQQLEREANEKLAQLAQQQQRERELHPAADAQQAARQQQQDNRQLALLAVKNYREVFLPGQMGQALQARMLPSNDRRQLERLNAHLMNNGWWKQQDAAQLPGLIRAYGDTLRTLTTALLGFDLAAPPLMPGPFSPDSLNARLATDVFDQPTATRLLREAALSEKLFASTELIPAVNEFSRLSTAVPAQPQDVRKLRDDVQAGMRAVNKGMGYYVVRVNQQLFLYEAEDGLLKAATAYEAKNGQGK